MESSDLFAGGVAPLEFFQIQVAGLRNLSAESEYIFAPELCMIGLAAYFEAFCKNQFAAVINICPELVATFLDVRQTKIPAKDLLHAIEALPFKIGFLITEEYDFGSAKLINALFCDLLKITPFSKDEIDRYSDFLNDRNLLVHHGGVFTMKYATEKFSGTEIAAKAHCHGLAISNDHVQSWVDFLNGIAVKMATSSERQLHNFSAKTGITFNELEMQAIEDTVRRFPTSE